MSAEYFSLFLRKMSLKFSKLFHGLLHFCGIGNTFLNRIFCRLLAFPEEAGRF